MIASVNKIAINRDILIFVDIIIITDNDQIKFNKKKTTILCGWQSLIKKINLEYFYLID